MDRKQLTKEQMDEFLHDMQDEVENDDFEVAHTNADNILCEILDSIGGFENILEAYESVGKWYA